MTDFVIRWHRDAAVVIVSTSWVQFRVVEVDAGAYWQLDARQDAWPQDREVLDRIVSWINGAAVRGFGKCALEGYLTDLDKLAPSAIRYITRPGSYAYIREAIERVGDNAPIGEYKRTVEWIKGRR